MSNRFLIDIGSSTVKVYIRKKQKISMITQKTFDFKEGFCENWLSDDAKNELYDFFEHLVNEYAMTNRNTKLYATGIFRDICNKNEFIEDFFYKTGLYFNIISHNLEAFYLEKAWTNNSSKIEKMVVINIGGKTTELLLCEKGEIIGNPLKLLIGVGSIIKKFPSINNSICSYSLDYIVKDIILDISKQIPEIDKKYDVAIYTGGELTYMRCADYQLVPNTMFSDENHPYMIDTTKYVKRNNEIFSSIPLLDLKKMMPDNPEWMVGARACSAIAQAIVHYFGISTIIPSNSNLIDGVNIQEANNVVICGSFNKHLKQIEVLINNINSKGITVLSPKNTEVVGSENDFVLFKDDIVVNHNTWAVEELHLKAIDKCDLVIACNYENYLGVSTTFELIHAYQAGKKIVFVEDNEIADLFGKRMGKQVMPCEVGLL